jgi:hypothetical protein
MPDFVVISCCACRASNLQVSTTKSVDSVHKGGVTWLDLDGIDHRWLLAAAADASVAAYDTEACTALISMMTFIWVIGADLPYNMRRRFIECAGAC